MPLGHPFAQIHVARFGAGRDLAADVDRTAAQVLIDQRDDHIVDTAIEQLHIEMVAVILEASKHRHQGIDLASRVARERGIAPRQLAEIPLPQQKAGLDDGHVRPGLLDVEPVAQRRIELPVARQHQRVRPHRAQGVLRVVVRDPVTAAVAERIRRHERNHGKDEHGPGDGRAHAIGPGQHRDR